MTKKKKILFYCKHNSCRSQMAEGFLRHLAGGRFEIYSAGLTPRPIRTHVYTVMDEAGINIRKQTPKSIDHYLGREPLYRQVKETLPQGRKLSDYIVSVNVTALKA